PRTGTPRLVLDRLSLPPPDEFGTALDGIELMVHAGEVVGIAGISGNGQRELLAAISGEQPVAEPERIRIDGHPAGRLDARARRDLGLCYVPEERLGRGAVPEMSLAENALLTASGDGAVRHGFIRFGRVRDFARRC